MIMELRYITNAFRITMTRYFIFLFQREALHARIGEMLDTAGQCGVNVVCLQEAWSKLVAIIEGLYSNGIN